MSGFLIREKVRGDGLWVRRFVKRYWGDVIVVARGLTYYPHKQDGYIVELEGERAGLITYQIIEDACEIVVLGVEREGLGIGRALLDAVQATAVEAGCTRLWLITTNDNVGAIRYYQKHGFRMVAVHLDAVNEARKIKPSIPATGANNIPIRDELEFEMVLNDG